jgi:hypothetical protein
VFHGPKECIIISKVNEDRQGRLEDEPQSLDRLMLDISIPEVKEDFFASAEKTMDESLPS